MEGTSTQSGVEIVKRLLNRCLDAASDVVAAFQPNALLYDQTQGRQFRGPKKFLEDLAAHIRNPRIDPDTIEVRQEGEVIVATFTVVADSVNEWYGLVSPTDHQTRIDYHVTYLLNEDGKIVEFSLQFQQAA